MVLPTAFRIKLYRLSFLIPPDPSIPSDTETLGRKERREGRAFKGDKETY